MLNDNNIYAIFGWAKEGKDRKGREKISVYTLFGQYIYIYIYIWRERKMGERFFTSSTKYNLPKIEKKEREKVNVKLKRNYYNYYHVS